MSGSFEWIAKQVKEMMSKDPKIFTDPKKLKEAGLTSQLYQACLFAKSNCATLPNQLIASCEKDKLGDCKNKISSLVQSFCFLRKASPVCGWITTTRPAEITTTTKATPTTTSNNSMAIIIGCVIGGVVLLVVAVGIYMLCRKKMNKKGGATGTSATTGISGTTGVSGTTATTGTTIKKNTRTGGTGTGSSAV